MRGESEIHYHAQRLKQNRSAVTQPHLRPANLARDHPTAPAGICRARSLPNPGIEFQLPRSLPERRR
jgi:hypothetical protein